MPGRRHQRGARGGQPRTSARPHLPGLRHPGRNSRKPGGGAAALLRGQETAGPAQRVSAGAGALLRHRHRIADRDVRQGRLVAVRRNHRAGQRPDVRRARQTGNQAGADSRPAGKSGTQTAVDSDRRLRSRQTLFGHRHRRRRPGDAGAAEHSRGGCGASERGRSGESHRMGDAYRAAGADRAVRHGRSSGGQRGAELRHRRLFPEMFSGFGAGGAGRDDAAGAARRDAPSGVARGIRARFDRRDQSDRRQIRL
ncbi:hypothetical protein SDC9_104095 [bioreactor metagenome]|uniref:Uncharacterized protein n=1 Tax=bioreactor metagenome TaxID=1076179 RepID=A0A645B272_9ZZZZ